MRRLARLLIGGLVVTTAFAAAPTYAKPTPAGIWVDLRFTGANGSTKVVVEPLQIVQADAAQAECDNNRSLRSLAVAAIEDEPDLAKMTLASAKCEAGKTGAIKVTVGAWPPGSGPRGIIPPGWAPKVTPALLDGPPAVVLLTYVATNGAHVKTVVGYQDGVPSFYLRTCAARLQQRLPGLLFNAQVARDARARIGNRVPYDINTLKFVSANCIPTPSNFGALMASGK